MSEAERDDLQEEVGILAFMLSSNLTILLFILWNSNVLYYILLLFYIVLVYYNTLNYNWYKFVGVKCESFKRAEPIEHYTRI